MDHIHEIVDLCQKLCGSKNWVFPGGMPLSFGGTFDLESTFHLILKARYNITNTDVKTRFWAFDLDLH